MEPRPLSSSLSRLALCCLLAGAPLALGACSPAMETSFAAEPQLDPAVALPLDSLLEQRAASGIWGGLQSLPELVRLGGNPDATDLHAEVQLALADIGEIAELRVLPEFRHAFTHFRLRVTPLQIKLKRRYTLAAQAALFWQANAALDTAALPAPVRKLLTG